MRTKVFRVEQFRVGEGDLCRGIGHRRVDIDLERRDALAALLSDPRLQDPQPAGVRGTATAVYGAPLRLDYILPSADLQAAVTGGLPRQVQGIK